MSRFEVHDPVTCFFGVYPCRIFCSTRAVQGRSGRRYVSFDPSLDWHVDGLKMKCDTVVAAVLAVYTRSWDCDTPSHESNQETTTRVPSWLSYITYLCSHVVRAYRERVEQPLVRSSRRTPLGIACIGHHRHSIDRYMNIHT